MRAEPSILHVDLDAMFAAVEQRDKVSLRGRPVIVGGVAGRGVVSTASYEARAFGARSAMPMAQARRLCPPGTAYLSPRFAAYKKTSTVVMSLLQGVSPLVEQVSIDEAYVDLAAAGHDLSPSAVTTLALRLKAEIAEATGGVTGSIGAASSKLIAKIGSDLHKPDGLTVVVPGDELAFLHPLPVNRLGGVGPATEQRLHRSGVRTIGDLATVALDDLVDWFGTAHGTGLHRLARGDDSRPVISEREAKSVSAEETFDVDLTDPAQLNRELDLLSARVAGRLRSSGLTGRTVNIKVRSPDFTTVTRAFTRDQPTDDGRLLAQLARRLLAEVNTSGGVRLLGVGVSTLADFAQDDLFSAAAMLPTPPVPPPAGPVTRLPPGPAVHAATTSATTSATEPVADSSAQSAAGSVADLPTGWAAHPAIGSVDLPPGSAAHPAIGSVDLPPGSAAHPAGFVAAPAAGFTAQPDADSSAHSAAGSTGRHGEESVAGSAAQAAAATDAHPAFGSVAQTAASSVDQPVAGSAPISFADPSGEFVAGSPATRPGEFSDSSSTGLADPMASAPDGPAAGTDSASAGSPPAHFSGVAAVPTDAGPATDDHTAGLGNVAAPVPVWRPGQDVRHDDHGAGWVWGSGLGRVTVRFEGPHTPPGPVRTFSVDDPHLHPADPPDWTLPPLP
ncbi:DNA polymerase IV [Actinoplanes hulinensis]|uniref:DNA polymerase IV n=1 Tax=Actinoplanes hulinensis TaxID=1144547 RepID=UPI0027E26D70|nr:DNA polymerase IV [Actinoplanes hulinensis]